MATRPQDIRLHALNQSVALHTQSLRHLFSKLDDEHASAKATAEVLATARRFADWIDRGDVPGDQAAAVAPASVESSGDKREDMARALEHLVGVIREGNVAPFLFSVQVGASVATIAELETWAAALDAPIGPGGTDGKIPVVRVHPAATFGDIQLDVSVQSQEFFPDQPEGGDQDG